MRCRMVKTLLPLQIAGALRPEVAAQVDEHLAGCAACRMIAHELRANQPEASPTPTPAKTPPLSPPLESYRQHAALTRANQEVASAAARDLSPRTKPLAEPTARRSAAAEVPPAASVARPDRDRLLNPKEHKAVDPSRDDHSGCAKRRGLGTETSSADSTRMRSPKLAAQTIFLVLMVGLALTMGMAWRGAGLRLEAYQSEVTTGAIGELQADLKLIKDQLQPSTTSVALPPLTRESLAMRLLLKADSLHPDSYLPMVEAYDEMRSALALWRSEQGSAPSAIIAGFASEAAKAVDELVQALESLKASWPPSADQRAAVKQAATRIQGLALSYVDEGIVPGQFPEPKVSEQAALAAAAKLLPEGATPVKPEAIRRYQRRQGTDLWELSFTHNLQKWQVQVSADSGQVLGMMLPVPSKGDLVSLEQVEQTARAYLAERTEADRFVLFDRQEKEGQVLFTAQRVIAGLRYYGDPIKVGVARYGGTVTHYQRLQPGTAWAELPVYQLTAEQAKEQAVVWAAGQKTAGPSDEGSLGVALHPSRQERLVWGFSTSDPQGFIYVDAQSGESWR